MPEEQDTLQEVFGVEREISGKLAAERQQAEEWLERTRHEVEQATRSEIEALKERAAQAEEVATRAARDRSAEALSQARSAAERAGRLEDAQLVAIIRQRLVVILPEGAR